MQQEVEIQVIIKNPKEVERKLRKVGKFIGARKQVDKYFVPPYKDFFAKAFLKGPAKIPVYYSLVLAKCEYD